MACPVKIQKQACWYHWMKSSTKTHVSNNKDFNANSLNPAPPSSCWRCWKDDGVEKAESYYDRSALTLLKVEVRQEVRVAPFKKGQSWQAGSLVEQLSDRSYLVKTGSENIRQNRHFLKPRKCPQKLPKTSLLLQLLIKKETAQTYLIHHPVPRLILCRISLLILCLQRPQSAPVPEYWYHQRDAMTCLLNLNEKLNCQRDTRTLFTEPYRLWETVPISLFYFFHLFIYMYFLCSFVTLITTQPVMYLHPKHA